ncbi:MAG: YceI family protein [Calditrichaeota bacterium]|nr:MAG: YceI family protein [Calditrichota bacterium]
MLKISLLLWILFLSFSHANELQIDKTQKNQVTFTSDAPVEKIIGHTTEIDGYAAIDEKDLTQNSSFYFEVDLATLDTGIGLRNRHMRENYLQTGKYPFASYKGEIKEAVLLENGGYQVKARGSFDLHGVQKEMEISATVEKLENGYKASSSFEIALADFKIERPQLMLLKIGQVIKIDVSIYAKKVNP